MTVVDLTRISCNVCRQSGGLAFKKVRRFSRPLVVIGWLFLIPSFLGMGCGACGLVATKEVSMKAHREMNAAYERRLAHIDGLDAMQVREIVSMSSFDAAELKRRGLSTQQISQVKRAYDSHIARKAGAVLGGGLYGGAAMIFMVAGAAGSVFGWILVLRKKVIACAMCQGIHSEAVST